MSDQTNAVCCLARKWLSTDSEDEMYEAATNHPEIAWGVILELIKHHLTTEQEALLAAGPLEDLLVRHGETYISRIEIEAQRNPRFRHLLGGVWRREMPENIWDRITKARDVVW